jgi:hypothetical protein
MSYFYLHQTTIYGIEQFIICLLGDGGQYDTAGDPSQPFPGSPTASYNKQSNKKERD